MNREKELWKCPVCSHIISDRQHRVLRFSNVCSMCNVSYMYFIPAEVSLQEEKKLKEK